jgi:hypothetical protein
MFMLNPLAFVSANLFHQRSKEEQRKKKKAEMAANKARNSTFFLK